VRQLHQISMKRGGNYFGPFQKMKTHTRIKTTLTIVLAVMALGSSLLMAGAAAWQRSETPLDRALLLALSCVTVSAVHLLPSLTKSRAMWPLWVGCFVLAVYGHAGFFAFAGIKAGEARSSQSVQVQTIKAQQARITETLDTIKARPLAQVAALLSRTTAQDRREALTVELHEAKRAAALRDDLLRLEAELGSNATVTDPVTAQIASVTGANTQAVALALSLCMAALLELLGVLLWLELTSAQGSTDRDSLGDTHTQESQPQTPTALEVLREAVTAGKCKPTVASIRQFMQCGQAKASELRRELVV
jgi:hypothetical protein